MPALSKHANASAGRSALLGRLATEGAVPWDANGHTVALRHLPDHLVDEAVHRQIATPWGGDPLYQTFTDNIL